MRTTPGLPALTPRGTYPQVAALGGGHGLAATLSALRHISEQVTAVVTVADDGGSSGRLRQEFGVLPPGDLRMALTALCDDSEWGHTWSEVLQHRFPGAGQLGQHALGNLLIVSLWQLNEDPVAGLDLVGRLLQARGRVLPMSAVPLELRAQVRGVDPQHPERVDIVTGQVQIATTAGTVESIAVLPEAPPARVEAVEAVRAADAVVLGPGSWFTSVLTHLLVPDLRRALVETQAHKILTLNLELSTGETQGFSVVRHLETLREMAPELQVDTVLVDAGLLRGAHDDVHEACARIGAVLELHQVARPGHPGHHDALRLAAAYRDILDRPRTAR
ncbi:uridine diphosphate-N-acetylglucosamine-binding protein YvcK [Marihabitans asiaticum]|uniref:Putative gluconeogenesis factor n=1 Tax=Marihabitans asiaticum TaxID=415218 RepID=A0A560WAU0_9MICO|nr:uridine diphosphate-N-acetylglucosamine-binding protein YvcK [Marihabitans asiaticum]TWD14763.1 putative cofD-like protein [Marihabitans asiaticum]